MPRKIRYDNGTTAVARVMGHRTRQAPKLIGKQLRPYDMDMTMYVAARESFRAPFGRLSCSLGLSYAK